MKVGSKIEVVEMEQENFQNYREHLHKLYTERNKDADNHPLDFVNAVWFNFGRGEKVVDGKLVILEHSSDVWIRHTYDVGETPQCVSFRKKRGVQKGIDSLPPPLYDCYPIPIKKAKADGLRSLVSRYVPTA